MDLSMKNGKKLRLEDFLLQNLDAAPAPRVIEWVDRDAGVFRVLWTHQSSGAFHHDDAALFRYWALARGKWPLPSSVELKQSLRMALNKSPSVSRLPANASAPDYRYFRFVDKSRLKHKRSKQSSIHSCGSDSKQFQYHLQEYPLNLSLHSTKENFYGSQKLKEEYRELSDFTGNDQGYVNNFQCFEKRAIINEDVCIEDQSIECKVGCCDYVIQSNSQNKNLHCLANDISLVRNGENFSAYGTDYNDYNVDIWKNINYKHESVNCGNDFSNWNDLSIKVDVHEAHIFDNRIRKQCEEQVQDLVPEYSSRYHGTIESNCVSHESGYCFSDNFDYININKHH